MIQSSFAPLYTTVVRRDTEVCHLSPQNFVLGIQKVRLAVTGTMRERTTLFGASLRLGRAASIPCVIVGVLNAPLWLSDIEVVQKVWERVGSRMRLAIDGNRSLPARDAIRLSRQCSNVPFVFEQPCNTIEELISIRDRICHPLYTDESGDSLETLFAWWVNVFAMVWR